MDDDELRRFVESWAAAWNRRDVAAVLAHFHDDSVFYSPVAKQLLPGSKGILVGKEAIAEYWTLALSKIPDLHFKVERYFRGVDVIVIQYRNQREVVVNEVLMLEGDLVRQGFGTYQVDVENPTGITNVA